MAEKDYCVTTNTSSFEQLLQVLNSISKPPGSAPPFIPFKPVPRLVPLPSKHTLPVQQPNRFKLANFGQLREENLQIVLLAKRTTQQLVEIRWGPQPADVAENS